MRVFFLSLVLISIFASAQNIEKAAVYEYISFTADSVTFNSAQHAVIYENKNYFSIGLQKPDSEIDVEVHLNKKWNSPHTQLHHSEAVDLSDSLFYENDDHTLNFSFHLKEVPFLNNEFIITLADSSGNNTEIKIPVLVLIQTTVKTTTEPLDVFQEEEIAIDLPGENIWNLQASPVWNTNNEFDFKVSKEVNSIKVMIRSHLLGKRKLTIPLKSVHPIMQQNGSVGYNVNELEFSLNVKPNQIDFLNFEKEEIYFERSKISNGEEIQMRNSSNLILKKTYRIEDTQEPGGKLIAEVFTRSILANGKVLCFIRPFSLHRISEGYLYIKDGDKTRFISNLNILERPRIEQIVIMRNNEDWSDKLFARAGEKVEIKILGKGLLKTNVQLEGLVLKKDSISISDEVIVYHLKVPRDFSRKKSGFFLNNGVTAFDLQIREYQEPRKLDFVKLNYGDESVMLSNDKLAKPVLYEKLLKDVILAFDYDLIDNGDRFYGKQYLELEVKVVSPRGELKESLKKEVVICPGERSLRFDNYDRTDCQNSSLSLNDLLNTKTYNLEGYSQIFVSIRHNPKYYTNAGYSRSVKIILKRTVVFDLQVSFPAGLLIKRFDTEGIGSLSGISIAAFAQLSFYDQLQIGKIKPYRLGAGFLAINAFNFSDNTTVLRDVGIVLIGSVYPINRNSKFSFPLHTGIGYLMKQNAWFFMFGPGIEVRF